MKEKIALVLACLALALFIAACGDASGQESNNGTADAQGGPPAMTMTAQAWAILNAPTVTPLPTWLVLPTLTSTATNTPTSTPAPPTETLVPTSTPVPSPTLAPSPLPAPQAAVVPVASSDGNQDLRGILDVNHGHYIVLPGFTQNAATQPMVFHDRIVFRVDVFDPAVGWNVGDGIQAVKFTIYSGKKVVHEIVETVPAYCAFEGNAECYVWAFADHGNKWPAGKKIENGNYTLNVLIVSQSGKSANWKWSFRIDR